MLPLLEGDAFVLSNNGRGGAGGGFLGLSVGLKGFE